jgi:hypothetical protein
MLQLVAGIVLVASIVGYTLYQTRTYRRGPVLEVYSPQDGATLTDRLVTVRGHAANISYLELNDRQIFVNENGIFTEQLLLPVGYTILEVEAQDRFGRVRNKTLHLVLTAPPLEVSTTTAPVFASTTDQAGPGNASSSEVTR